MKGEVWLSGAAFAWMPGADEGAAAAVMRALGIPGNGLDTVFLVVFQVRRSFRGAVGGRAKRGRRASRWLVCVGCGGDGRLGLPARCVGGAEVDPVRLNLSVRRLLLFAGGSATTSSSLPTGALR